MLFPVEVNWHGVIGHESSPTDLPKANLHEVSV